MNQLSSAVQERNELSTARLRKAFGTNYPRSYLLSKLPFLVIIITSFLAFILLSPLGREWLDNLKDVNANRQKGPSSSPLTLGPLNNQPQINPLQGATSGTIDSEPKLTRFRL